MDRRTKVIGAGLAIALHDRWQSRDCASLRPAGRLGNDGQGTGWCPMMGQGMGPGMMAMVA
jgi:hypothetical protein